MCSKDLFIIAWHTLRTICSPRAKHVRSPGQVESDVRNAPYSELYSLGCRDIFGIRAFDATVFKSKTYRWYSMYLPCFWFLDWWQNESWPNSVSRRWRISLRALSVWFVTFSVRNLASCSCIVHLKIRNRVDTYYTDCSYLTFLLTETGPFLFCQNFKQLCTKDLK